MLANLDESIVMPTRAFLLGGRRGGADVLARAAGVSHKARIPVAGVPMAIRVLAALEACPGIDQTWLCIDDPELEAHDGVAAARDAGRLRIVPPAESPSASVGALFSQIEAPQPVLVTTADHPLLDAGMIEHFLSQALALDADVVAGVVLEATVQEHYPEAQRTFISFGDDRLTGANLFLLRTPAAARAVEFWQRMDAHRKKPWRLASQIGAGSLALYAMGQLDLAGALERLSRRIGARAAVLPLPQAEYALDVDRPEHLELVERILRERARA